jgi:hypothetical protein
VVETATKAVKKFSQAIECFMPFQCARLEFFDWCSIMPVVGCAQLVWMTNVATISNPLLANGFELCFEASILKYFSV